MLCCLQVHEEFSYGVSEQLLRARATEQVIRQLLHSLWHASVVSLAGVICCKF